MHAKDAPQQLEWQRLWSGDSPWARALLPAAILMATFLAYSATLALGFVFDDHVLIVTNDSIRSWRYFPSYFASHIWSFRYPHLLANYYRPFFLTWLRLNDSLFGLSPWGWHLTSVSAHLAVTYLVYRLCLRLTGDRWVAGIAGLLFGLHPVHVEAVADITSIQEPLSTFFILGAILTFCRSREAGPRLDWLAASLLLTGAALLSKESGLVLPILVSGFAWIYGTAMGREVALVEGRANLIERLRSALVASIPYWAVVLIYVPLRIRALKGFAHVVTPLSLSQEVFTIPSVLVFYLRLLVWPSGLSCYYDTPYILTPSWHDFMLPAALLAAVAAALAFWYGRTRRSAPEEAKTIAFACLWMILTLLPVLNFRFLPESEIAHDRYVYLPSVGFAIIIAMGLRHASGVVARFINRPAWALLAALVLSGVMGYATARQCLFWSDDLTLNYRAHEIAPHNVSATTSLAAAVAQRGMDGPAMALYQGALAIEPEFWRANVNVAYLYYAHGNFPEAARFFSRACAADPTDGDQFLYLGMSLLRMGRLAEAEKAVRSALLVRPQGRNYHLGLGMVLKGEGRLAEARQEIEAALAEDGQNTQARTLIEELTREMKAEAEKSSAEQAPKGRPPNLK
jgi:Flp pilus assembly protein TadD